MLLGALRTFVNGFQQNTSTDVSSPRPRNYERRQAYRWLYKNIFSTFRYGMVLLYVGTLLIVIGYHNPSIIFARYIGMVLVVVGLLCIGGAVICGFQRYIFGEDNDFEPEPDRAESTDSKRSLPTYDHAMTLDLPTYDEAMILKEADDANRQRNPYSAERSGAPSTSTNQPLTLWPSIGHYSSRISPIAEVEERPTTTVASSTQTTAIVSHGGQIISSPGSPPLYEDATVWNTGVENLPFNTDDGLIELHSESPFPSTQRINPRWKPRNKRRRDSTGIRNETRAELILAPSFSRSPIDRPCTVLPILTYRNETRPSREASSNTSSTFPYHQQMDTDSISTHVVAEHVIDTSVHISCNLNQEVAYNGEINEHDDATVVITDQENLHSRQFEGLPLQSRSNSILNRPRTSVTRPGTAATLFLESCSTSLYSQASFDDDSSSILSDWDDLPSIESLDSQTNQEACTESDIILENLEVGNDEEQNKRSSANSLYSLNANVNPPNQCHLDVQNESENKKILRFQDKSHLESANNLIPGVDAQEENHQEDLILTSITYDINDESYSGVSHSSNTFNKDEEEPKLTSVGYDTTLNMHSI